MSCLGSLTCFPLPLSPFKPSHLWRSLVGAHPWEAAVSRFLPGPAYTFHILLFPQEQPQKCPAWVWKLRMNILGSLCWCLSPRRRGSRQIWDFGMAGEWLLSPAGKQCQRKRGHWMWLNASRIRRHSFVMPHLQLHEWRTRRDLAGT